MTIPYQLSMADYVAGMASVTNSSNVVNFTGAALTSVDPATGQTNFAVQVGDAFIVGKAVYEIDSIVSATQLTLVQDYAGTTNGAVAYKIRHRSIPSNSAMAAAIAQLLALGSDAAPDHSRTLDDSTARLKFYFDSFLAKLAVGAYSGGVLQSLKEALSIDPATGVVSFPNGMKHNNPGFRNRLINGNFDVWQRGTSFTIANGASAYTADRRLISNYTGVSITVAQVNAPAGFLGRFALNITATGVNDGGYVVISRRMEASDLADLDSKTCVFAFDANGSTSVGTIDGYSRFACNSAIDNSSWSVYPGAALFAFPVGSGRIVSAFSAAITAGIKYGADLQTVFGQHSATGNWNISIGAEQFEADPSGAGKANPFEFRPLPVELAMCQRYFETSYDDGVAPGTAGVAPGDCTHSLDAPQSYSGVQCRFKTLKRATPTVTLYSPGSGAVGKIYDTNGAVDCVAAPYFISKKGFTAGINNVAVATSHTIAASWTASAEL